MAESFSLSPPTHAHSLKGQKTQESNFFDALIDTCAGSECVWVGEFIPLEI